MLFDTDLSTIICMIPVLLFSVAIHECMHATVAYKLGDKAQKLYGRMTLDPFAHMDIFGFISILLIGFGWGKPVIVDDTNFKNRNRDNMLVALAGPLSNLCIAILLTVILKVLDIVGLVPVIFSSTTIGNILFDIYTTSITFNVIFAVFNMLPLPPFDGSKILRYFLPRKGKEILDMVERYSFYIILIIAFTGASSYVISPIVNSILNILQWFLML